MSLVGFELPTTSNPVDTIEQVALSNDWSFERSSGEITISVTGGQCDYHLSFSWLDGFEALHLACAFDLKVPDTRRTEVCQRHGGERADADGATSTCGPRPASSCTGSRCCSPATWCRPRRRSEGMLSHAIETCELHFQAFQYVVWAGRSAAEALDAVLFETVGEA